MIGGWSRERTSDTLDSLYLLFPEGEKEAQRGEVTVIKANLGLELSSLKSWGGNPPTLSEDEKLYLNLRNKSFFIAIPFSHG